MTRAAAMDLGVSEFVAKPVNNRDLVNRIQVHLSNLEWDRAADRVVSQIDKSTRHSIPRNSSASLASCC